MRETPGDGYWMFPVKEPVSVSHGSQPDSSKRPLVTTSRRNSDYVHAQTASLPHFPERCMTKVSLPTVNKEVQDFLKVREY